MRNQVLHPIENAFGSETAIQIQQMMDKANKPRVGLWAQGLGGILLIIGSSALFSEIQSGLNRIWGVCANPKSHWWTFIKNRLLSFLMVLVVALLLLLTFLLSVGLTTMTAYISRYLNIGALEILLIHSSSFFIGVLLFAMTFKILPDATIQWRNVWVGALITTVLFTAGKYVLGIYFNRFQIASMYGAAGSLILLLIWVYYSTQIFFIGAILTKVISLQKMAIIEPKRHAVLVSLLEKT